MPEDSRYCLETFCAKDYSLGRARWRGLSPCHAVSVWTLVWGIGSGFEMVRSSDWQVAGCRLGHQLGCGQRALLLLHRPLRHTAWWLGSRSKGPSRKRVGAFL